MAQRFQISFDANDPRALGTFWAVALDGYVEQPPPEGHDSWEAFALAVGLPEEEWTRMCAFVDPTGALPRLLFQRVPEGKQSKNRVHLDVNVGAPHDDFDPVRRYAERLVAAGATLVEERSDLMSRWMVLLDPEGNEFCVQ